MQTQQSIARAFDEEAPGRGGPILPDDSLLRGGEGGPQQEPVVPSERSSIDIEKAQDVSNMPKKRPG
eukprot:12440091-Alexandrium_andersonii.AAC.1